MTLGPELYEYQPKEAKDGDVFEMTMRRGAKPEEKKDPKWRKKYEKYLAKHAKESSEY